MSTTTDPPKDMRVLLIDDDSIDRENIRRVLRRQPVELIDFSNGKDALEWMKDHPVDCVLLDYNIPGTDTKQLIDEFIRRRLSVVMLTGQDAASGLAEDVLSRGVQDFLAKDEVNASSLMRALKFALERSRRLFAENELDTAASVQQSLLPTRGPIIESYEVDARSFPASRAGGDYFGYYVQPDGPIFLAVADVSGHDLGAALLMVQLQAYLDVCMEQREAPEAAISRIQRLISLRSEQSTTFHRFITSFMIWLEPATGSLVYAGAGHEAFLLRENGQWETLPSTGAPFGMASRPIGISEPVTIETGDLLLVPTDGLIEAFSPDGTTFDKSRLLSEIEALRHLPAGEIVDQIYQIVREHSGGLPQDDDMTAMVIKRFK